MFIYRISEKKYIFPSLANPLQRYSQVIPFYSLYFFSHLSLKIRWSNLTKWGICAVYASQHENIDADIAVNVFGSPELLIETAIIQW